jgi:hypothetical protein
VFGRVLELLRARHSPLAHGRDDPQFGREHLKGHVEAHLVVALAGAAVRDRHGAHVARRVDHQLGDQGAPQSRRERVATLVEAARQQRRPDEVVDEDLPRVERARFDGARLERLLLDRLEILALSQLCGEADDVEVVSLLDPLHGDRRVEPSAVRQYDLFPFHVGVPRYSRSGGVTLASQVR